MLFPPTSPWIASDSQSLVAFTRHSPIFLCRNHLNKSLKLILSFFPVLMSFAKTFFCMLITFILSPLYSIMSPFLALNFFKWNEYSLILVCPKIVPILVHGSLNFLIFTLKLDLFKFGFKLIIFLYLIYPLYPKRMDHT